MKRMFMVDIAQQGVYIGIYFSLILYYVSEGKGLYATIFVLGYTFMILKVNRMLSRSPQIGPRIDLD